MSDGLEIGTLSGRIELEDRMTHALEAVGGAIGKFEDSWKSAAGHVLDSAAGFFTAEAAMKAVEGAIHLGIETIKELTLEGAKVGDVEQNFEHLMDTAGRLGSTLMGALKEGTHNTISDMELMQTVNRDLAAGLNLTDAQFKTLSQGAFALAQATGTSVKEAFETMNDAMLTGRTRALAMLTGQIDLTKAEEDYAKKIGQRVEVLTGEEKIQAKREAILKAVGEATQRLGEQTDGLDEKVDQAATTWKNFQEELGKTIASSPVLLEGFDAIRDELIAAFGGNSENLIKSIAEAIDNAAISAVEFGKYVSDAIGIAGTEWNAFKVVVGSAEQGFRAITYVVEEVLLGLMKVANFVSGGSLFGDAIKATEQDIDRLYNAMAEGENKIAGYKQAEDEWAISTGHVNEALDRIKERMEAAKKAHEEGTAATAEHSAKTKELGANSGEAAGSVEKLGTQTRMTKEEQKKFNEAIQEMNSVGKDWHATLNTINGDVVEAVKYYLEAGVSLDKLATAYGLTQTQAEAVKKSWEEGTQALKNQIKAAEELGDAWTTYYNELQDLTSTDLDKSNRASLEKYEKHIKMLQDMGIADTKYYDDAYKLYQADVQKNEQALIAKDTKSKAYLQQQIRDAEQTYNMMRSHSDQYTSQDIANQGKIVQSLKDMEAGWGKVNAVIDKQTEMVRTLSGEVITLKEYEARQASGGSYNINAANFDQWAQSMGLNIGAARILAQKGYSAQGIVEMLRSGNINVNTLPPGPGPRIPGFKDGGVGDFGDGTLAILHGKEAVVPLEKPLPGLGAPVTITQYINGTAAEVARKVSDEIMRTLKQQRQFGAA